MFWSFVDHGNGVYDLAIRIVRYREFIHILNGDLLRYGVRMLIGVIEVDICRVGIKSDLFGRGGEVINGYLDMGLLDTMKDLFIN